MNGKIRAAIYGAITLWIVAFFQIISARYMVTDTGITQAFVRNQLVITRSSVELKANLGQKTMDESVVRKLIPGEVLITSRNENGQNYAHVQASQEEQVESLLSVRATLEKLCENSRLHDYELAACVEGKVAGCLDSQGKASIGDSFFRLMGAVKTGQRQTDGYQIFYGYSPGLGEGWSQDGTRTNLTIVITYDEDHACTRVYMGTPFLTEF